MKHSTIERTFLALILASALPLAACGKTETPTSPTQPGPPVVTTPTVPTPEPPSVDPTPTPTPPPTDDRPIVTITGPVVNLARSGAGDLDASFRIDDFTVVRVAAGTPVISGGATFGTDALRSGQTVTVEGRRTNGFLDATKVTIDAQAP